MSSNVKTENSVAATSKIETLKMRIKLFSLEKHIQVSESVCKIYRNGTELKADSINK